MRSTSGDAVRDLARQSSERCLADLSRQLVPEQDRREGPGLDRAWAASRDRIETRDISGLISERAAERPPEHPMRCGSRSPLWTTPWMHRACSRSSDLPTIAARDAEDRDRTASARIRRPASAGYGNLTRQLPLALTLTSPVVTDPRRIEGTDPKSVPGIDPRDTFDAFVIGSSNRFAHAAALSVAEDPGHNYNPLFIHGHAGLGKTHLLHAIGNYVCSNFPAHRVKYITTEAFMNEFVYAIRSNSTMEFKRRYREECDVLLVDDVQFMAGKEQLQEEFFHTFNQLFSASKQIVITSDRPPKMIATLRGPAQEPLRLGAHHRRPAAGARDPHGHLVEEGRRRRPLRRATMSSS